jgi:proteasome lid subunit RPN8/RPN11
MDVPVTTLKVTRTALAAMEAAADREYPREACGILLGHDDTIMRIQRAANVHPDPENRFEIDPQTLIDAHRAARGGGPAVLGYFHSHPAGGPAPSAIDAAMAAGDNMAWAILGDGQIRFWRDHPTGFRPLSYSVFRA